MTGPQRRAEILDALRRGTVPRDGLVAFAVGMERFETAIDADLAAVALGRGASRRFVANMGAARHSLLAGFKSAPALQAALQQAKCKFPRQKRPCIDGRPCIVASPSASRLPIDRTAHYGRLLTRGFTRLKRMCSRQAASTLATRAGCSLRRMRWSSRGCRGSLARLRPFPQCCAHIGAHSWPTMRR
jgi:hypothetical protein